jgi:LmbE family N-acetylglucosaminyl deacetylase
MRILALGCHPDDIEFQMAGTLLHLKDRGCELHYMTLANGSCGTAVDDRETIVRVRREEARRAAALLGATFHEALTDDLDVFYTPELVARTAAVVREVAPDILLTQPLEDYMEDHMITGRIASTAAFVRGMRNFVTRPPRPPVEEDVVIYHAQPTGHRTRMKSLVRPEIYVDVSPVLQRKRELLAQHASQKDWLDRSQGYDSYLNASRERDAELGKISGVFSHAEGWRRHLHIGYAARDIDPLADLLGALCRVDPAWAGD